MSELSRSVDIGAVLDGHDVDAAMAAFSGSRVSARRPGAVHAIA